MEVIGHNTMMDLTFCSVGICKNNHLDQWLSSSARITQGHHHPLREVSTKSLMMEHCLSWYYCGV